MQQLVEVIIENDRAHATEEIGDVAHDEVSVDGEEEGVVHAAVLAECKEEQGWWADEEVPPVKSVNDQMA